MDPKALVYKQAKFKLREARRLRRKARRDYIFSDDWLKMAEKCEAEALQVLGAIDKWFETI